jgi:phospholipid transport system substrate-binding protein
MNRAVFALLPFALVIASAAPPVAAEDQAPATAQSLCDAMLKSMKDGQSLGYQGRLKLFEDELGKAYDLPFMTRVSVGPAWRTLAPDQQAALVKAFGDYSAAVYAARFKSFSGEKFEVDPAASTTANGTVVHTKLVPSDGDPVQLDYLMRDENGQWKIIDVYLNGTISELAARRSEYQPVLRSGGAAALIKSLQDKTAQMGQG